MSIDTQTAQAFANSWNNLPRGSVYTQEQFEDWMLPLTQKDIEEKNVLELGCGNGSILSHIAGWNPKNLVGVDLGDSVVSARNNVKDFSVCTVVQNDLVEYVSDGFDVVYCIGVIHHLKNPKMGLDSVLRNTKSGGRFHVWVYAREGNNVIVYFVDPIRKIVSHLPWWFTKYIVATPLVVPYYIYAKSISFLKNNTLVQKLPLYEYSLWIAKREFGFFRHVAFDQLVTPQTTYISKSTIENWLASYSEIDTNSTYITMRNGNSWKFGGKLK